MLGGPPYYQRLFDKLQHLPCAPKLFHRLQLLEAFHCHYQKLSLQPLDFYPGWALGKDKRLLYLFYKLPGRYRDFHPPPEYLIKKFYLYRFWQQGLLFGFHLYQKKDR